jgi:hypothetical protein
MKNRIANNDANGFPGGKFNRPPKIRHCGRRNFPAPLQKNSWPADAVLPAAPPLPRRHQPEDFIVVPPTARAWELSAFPLSTRLTYILAGRECRRLGDLHGLQYSEILKWRNVGQVTLRELMALIKSVQQGDWNRRFGADANRPAGDFEI